MNRRTFLAGAPAALALAQTSAGQRLPIRKAIVYGGLPQKGPDGRTLTPLERFQMAKKAGFEQIECHTTEEPKAVQELKAAAQSTVVEVTPAARRSSGQPQDAQRIRPQELRPHLVLQWHAR